MLISCYKAIGDRDGELRAARRALERAEKVVAQDPANGSAMGHGVAALAALGESERAKEWAERALLLDPDNMNMRYNFACMYILDLHDHEAALDILESVLAKVRIEALRWIRTDPDLDAIRDASALQGDAGGGRGAARPRLKQNGATQGPVWSNQCETRQAEKLDPQPQVVVAFGFLMTNCAPSRPS